MKSAIIFCAILMLGTLSVSAKTTNKTASIKSSTCRIMFADDLISTLYPKSFSDPRPKIREKIGPKIRRVLAKRGFQLLSSDNNDPRVGDLTIDSYYHLCESTGTWKSALRKKHCVIKLGFSRCTRIIQAVRFTPESDLFVHTPKCWNTTSLVYIEGHNTEWKAKGIFAKTVLKLLKRNNISCNNI